MNIFSLKAKAIFKSFFLFFITFIFLTSTNITFSASNEILLEDYGKFNADIKKSLAAEDSSEALASYINMLVNISFGIGSIVAVGLIIWGGIEYITSESFSKKTDGKDKLLRAFGGLIILFSAFIFFDTINPQLLKVSFNPPVVGDKTSGKMQVLNCQEYKDKEYTRYKKHRKDLGDVGFTVSQEYLTESGCKYERAEKVKKKNGITSPRTGCYSLKLSGQGYCEEGEGGRDRYYYGWKEKE